jgi:hypothetical protein
MVNMTPYQDQSYIVTRDAHGQHRVIFHKGTWAKKKDSPQSAISQSSTGKRVQLNVVKNKYPMGTKYICAQHSTKYNKYLTVKGTLQFHEENGKLFITDGWGGCVWYDGKWADILSSPLQEDQQTAVKIAQNSVFGSGSIPPVNCMDILLNNGIPYNTLKTMQPQSYDYHSLNDMSYAKIKNFSDKTIVTIQRPESISNLKHQEPLTFKPKQQKVKLISI